MNVRPEAKSRAPNRSLSCPLKDLPLTHSQRHQEGNWHPELMPTRRQNSNTVTEYHVGKKWPCHFEFKGEKKNLGTKTTVKPRLPKNQYLDVETEEQCELRSQRECILKDKAWSLTSEFWSSKTQQSQKKKPEGGIHRWCGHSTAGKTQTVVWAHKTGWEGLVKTQEALEACLKPTRKE